MPDLVASGTNALVLLQHKIEICEGFCKVVSPVAFSQAFPCLVMA